ncbi:MAG: phosphatidylinositol transfer protein [Polyangiales bacterium]
MILLTACAETPPAGVTPPPPDAAGDTAAQPDDAAPDQPPALDDVAPADASSPGDVAPDLAAPPDAPAPDAPTPDAPTPDAPAPDAPPADAAVAPADVPADGFADASADAPPDASVASCPPPPACNVAPPTLGATASWRHLTTRVTVALGAARHRGRDLLLREGDPQWALGKFAYGINDDDLNDEDIDVWLLRDCTRWESLGTVATSRDAAPHAPVEGVSDDGGRVYLEIPAARRLAVGWHKVLFVVRGDHTTAEQWIRVAPAGARVAVTDVDGTLTESENAAFLALLTGPPPAANPGGPEVIRALVDRGYEVMYLTARPEWLEPGTHQWLALRGFPRSVVHTTLGLTGALGAAAETFKTEELRALRTRFGMAPDIGIGNTDSDVGAYTGVMVGARYYYRFAGDVRGGSRVDDYNMLAARLRALAPVCR